MRCLYCGNELALLKKLTGHGEFCSEAHRQKYQEQYNRLALTRLLQAQDSEPERRPLPTARFRPGPSATSTQPNSVPPAAPPDSPPPPAAAAAPAEYPKLSGFLPHQFEPALSPSELFSTEPFLAPVTACLPAAGVTPFDLGTAASSGLQEIGRAHPLPLAIQRLQSRPVDDQGVQTYTFAAEFRNTIAAVLTLIDIKEALPEPPGERVNGSGKRPPAAGGDQPSVVVNLDALLDPAPAPVKSGELTGPGPIVIAGWLDDELEELREAPAEQPPVLPNEPKPAPPAQFAQPQVLPNEPKPAPVPPAQAVAATVLPNEREPPAVATVLPDSPAPETAPEIVPAACLEFIELRLELAGDAFTPINEAAFAGPDFQIHTPATAAAPLRAKVVFGPSPAGTLEIPPADAALVEEPGSLPETPEPASPSRAESAAAPDIDSPAKPHAQDPRRADEILPPDFPKPGSPAQTAARLRSMAALARKAQEDLANPPQDVEPRPEPPPPPVAPPPSPARGAGDPNLEALRYELERMGTPATAPSARSRRIAVTVGFLLAILLIGYLIKQSFATSSVAASPESRLETYGAGLVSGENGWSLWTDSAQRQLQVFRPSLPMSDYRIEFRGEIQEKGLGWFFRAANERNYYSMKLEMVETGLNPKVMLTRSAVINGEATQNLNVELPMQVHLDTVYKIRTDVWDSTFRTYIQDQLVDTWTDDRLRIGGFGLLRDAGELSQVRSIQLHGLRLVAE